MADKITRITVVMIGGTEKAFLKAEATELLITWLMPHQQISRNGKQDGDQGVTGLCLAFAGEKVMDIIGRTAPVAAV